MNPSPASNSRLPQHIALINVARPQDESLTRLLLGDFKDALAAYARISCAHTPTFALKPDEHADTVIIACTDPLDFQKCSDILDALFSQTRVYTIACTASPEPTELLPHLEKLHTLCGQHSFQWCGAFAIGSSDVLKRKINQPRMGLWRRWSSEAMDRFIGVVRCGETVANAERAASSPFDDEIRCNVVFARCTLPAFIQHIITR